MVWNQDLSNVQKVTHILFNPNVHLFNMDLIYNLDGHEQINGPMDPNLEPSHLAVPGVGSPTHTSGPILQIRENPLSYNEREPDPLKKPTNCGQCRKKDNNLFPVDPNDDAVTTSSNNSSETCQFCRGGKNNGKGNDLESRQNAATAVVGNGTTTFNFRSNSDAPHVVAVAPNHEIEEISDRQVIELPIIRETFGKKWQYFPGKNKFFCDGRIMTSPSIRFCALTFLLIMVTFTLFIVFEYVFHILYCFGQN